MNVTTYIFSLSDISADDLRWAKEPWTEHPACPAFSITPQELAWLGEVLDVDTHQNLLRGFSLVAGESQEPPWVVSIPEDLVSALRNIAAEDSHPLAARWGMVDEVGDIQSLDSLIHFLEKVVDFLEFRPDPIVLHITSRSN